MVRRYLPPDTKSSIGEQYVIDAVAALKRTQQTAAAVMTSYDFSREQTLRMLFEDDTIDKMQAVRGMVEPDSPQGAYDVGVDVELTIDYKGARLPTITPNMLQINPQRAEPLMAYIAQVRAIHEQYETVKGVLRWLNRNATIGAIRYYWPSALQLCPTSPAFKDMQHVPTRFVTPAGISQWMQAIKDSAATVAGSLLLPATATPRPRGQMWLSFDSYTITFDQGANFRTDQVHYYI